MKFTVLIEECCGLGFCGLEMLSFAGHGADNLLVDLFLGPWLVSELLAFHGVYALRSDISGDAIRLIAFLGSEAEHSDDTLPFRDRISAYIRYISDRERIASERNSGFGCFGGMEIKELRKRQR